MFKKLFKKRKTSSLEQPKNEKFGIKGYIGEKEIQESKEKGITLGELTESWSWSRPGIAKELMERFCIPYLEKDFKVVKPGTGSGKYSIEMSFLEIL
jgi:hypothetical protein